MFNFIKFKNSYNRSLEIINLYDSLINNGIDINDKKYKLFITKINSLIDNECRLYNKLSIDEIKDFGDKILEYTNEYGINLVDIRISNRLSITYDKLIGNIIRNNGLFPTLDDDLEFSLFDIINSKISIDIYKLIDSKLKNIFVLDKKSVDYASKINSLNKEHIVYKLSLYELSERFLLSYNFDISKLPDIDLLEIEKRFLEDSDININLKDIINDKIYINVLSIIDGFKKNMLNQDKYESIYDNLVFVSELEILFNYLYKEQLVNISSYLNELNIDNNIAIDNVKRLVRSKINEF